MSKNKFLQWLSEAAAKWPMNTDPVVMQASGYVPTKTGVEYNPSEGSKRLSDNIATISIIPNMLMNSGMTGIIPAVASEVGAAAGGVGGTYVGQKLDNKLDTTYWTPTLGFFGTLLGGGLGYKAGNKYGKYAIKHDMLPEGAANRRIVTDDMVKEAIVEMFESNTRTTPKILQNSGPLRYTKTFDVTPQGSNTRVYETHLYDVLSGKDIGQIAYRSFKDQPLWVDRIIGSLGNKGVGRDLYSTVVAHHPQGLISGERLVSPEKTIATWKHTYDASWTIKPSSRF